jgi:ribonuclease D
LWGEEILVAVKRGIEAPLVEREQVRRPSDAMLRRLEKLKNWRKTKAKELGVESDVVLPKVYLNSLAENPPKNLDDLKSLLVDSPWRFQQYAAQLLKIVGG